MKTADDKSKRLALLEDLQKSHLLDAKQKTWLRQELGRFRKGIQGERDSAYYLDQYFKGGPLLSSPRPDSGTSIVAVRPPCVLANLYRIVIPQ